MFMKCLISLWLCRFWICPKSNFVFVNIQSAGFRKVTRPFLISQSSYPICVFGQNMAIVASHLLHPVFYWLLVYMMKASLIRKRVCHQYEFTVCKRSQKIINIFFLNVLYDLLAMH